MGYDLNELIKVLSAKTPLIVGMTGYSRYRFASYAAIREIKHNFPECTMVAGGRHFSALAEESLKNIKQIDIVVRGEGEITFKEICEAIKKGTDLDNIKGISYRKNGKIISNIDRELEKNIEQLSYSIKDLPKGPYHLKVPVSLKKGDDISNPVSIMTSRGCPGRCVYCCLSAGRVRYRDPVAVVDEIEQKMKIADTNEISISDSSFTVNKNHVGRICEEILNRKLNIIWRCQSRVNIDMDILKMMKNAGCIEVSIGIESASTKVLKAIKKNINLDQAAKFFEISHNLGISVLAYFMVSLPEETESDAQETFRFIKEYTQYMYKPSLQIAQIYPDAQLYYIAKEKGLLPEGFSWFKPYQNPYVKDLGGRANIPYYLENLSIDFLKSYLNQYNKYYFKHFYYKEELGINLSRRLKTFVFDWENESLYRKVNRFKTGMRMISKGFKNR